LAFGVGDDEGVWSDAELRQGGDSPVGVRQQAHHPRVLTAQVEPVGRDGARDVPCAVGRLRRVAVAVEAAVHDEDGLPARSEPGHVDKVGVHGRTS
jgi:hypothetical protein